MAAVNDFTSRALSCVPAEWVSDTLCARGHSTAMPMCEMLFLVDELPLVNAIRNHITSFDFGDDRKRQQLIDAGWGVIPKTGLFARELDGFLLLGIDGTGYDFFDFHWRPLYDLLELGWQLDD